MIRILGFLACLQLSFAFSQTDTEAIADSTKKEIHSVRKASLLSTVVPGAGQIYNHTAMPKGKKKAYWKVPLIYAGLGTTTFFLIQNNNLQRDLKREYNNRIAGTGDLDPRFDFYDNQGVLQLYTYHLNQRDLFILATGVTYLIQLADAAVEAHFVSFDISEDLSLQIRPSVMSMQQAGIQLSFRFR